MDESFTGTCPTCGQRYCGAEIERLKAQLELDDEDRAEMLQQRTELIAATIERCAQVARDKLLSYGHVDLAVHVETAIRALKDKL